MIAKSTIQEVKSKTDILDVVGGFVTLKRKGVNHTGLCPFHSEKTGSFTVNPAKQIFKCFGCGKGGDAITFIVEHEKVNYLDAIRWLANKYNIPVEEEGKKEFVKPQPRLEKVGKKVIDWFEVERKISNNTLLRFQITEATEYMPQLGQEVPVICFNYYREGELVNIKFRGPKKSFKLAKDAELIMYNLDALKEQTDCVITEGEMDCLALYEAGVYNAVSVPNGASKGKQRLEYLDNCYEYFLGMRKVILAVDNDGPGNELREELARRIGKVKCYQVKYPDGCKDANDVLKIHGPGALKEIVESATRWPIEGEIGMDAMFSDIVDYYENGYPPGAATKIPGFDELLTFAPGMLTMVTGIPGSGKDEFVNHITTSLTRFHDWSWGIWPMEETAQISVTKLIEKFAGKSFSPRKDPRHRMNQKEFEHGLAMVDKYYHFINVNKVDITVNGVIEKAKELVERYGINGMVISPWNCLEHKIQYGLSETLYISEKLTQLINFLGEYGVHCFLLAHPRKVDKNRQTGKYNIPTLYDINGSANFYNKTHNGFCVYRDFDTGQVDIYVQKVKFHWHGKQGYCTFHYNVFTRQYEVIGSSEPPQQELGNGAWRPVSLPYADHKDDSPFNESA